MSDRVDGLLDALGVAVVERNELLEAIATVELARAAGKDTWADFALFQLFEVSARVRQCIEQRGVGEPTPACGHPSGGGDSDADVTIISGGAA